MKYLILVLCLIAMAFLVSFLNIISEGNVVGVGLGDAILQTIGTFAIYIKLKETIFDKKK